MDGGLNSSWIVNGTKGVDFAGNLDLFDFATVHLCESLLPSVCLRKSERKHAGFAGGL